MTELTYAEYEVIYELRVNQGFDPGLVFNPAESFPNRDNTDNARRRTVDRLASKGLVKKFRYGGGNGYALTEAACLAMAEYREGLERKEIARLAKPQKSLADYLNDESGVDITGDINF